MSGTGPRRRHSPQVYRRRRIVLLIGVLVIAAAVWALIAQPWNVSAAQSTHTGSPTSDAATELPVPVGQMPTPDATASTPIPGATEGTPAPEATEGTPAPEATGDLEPCVARAVTVEAVTDKDTYGQGQNPLLSIRLTNKGETDCTLNVGTTTQKFTITSGSDTWWQSTDCQVEPSDMIVVIAAGATVTSAAPLTWDRTRSSVDSCASARPSAPAGGASYHLSVSIGGIKSAESALFLLY